MSELKTLKEINQNCPTCDTAVLLRQEAIKHIKFIQEVFIDGVDMDKSPARTQREAFFHQKGKQDALKNFFNIEESELNG